MKHSPRYITLLDQKANLQITSMLPRKPYEGSTRKLVLAFDVGTTFSGVSYCILDPGKVPVIQAVSKSVVT
jgi:hypothetical protein